MAWFLSVINVGNEKLKAFVPAGFYRFTKNLSMQLFEFVSGEFKDDQTFMCEKSIPQGFRIASPGHL